MIRSLWAGGHARCAGVRLRQRRGGTPATLDRFDTLFGARRGEFGPTSLFGALARSNLISPGLKVEITPGKRFDAR